MAKYGFIGAGNMGGALACALAKNIDGSEILINDSIKEKAEQLAESLCASYARITEVAEFCDFIFIAVKPQVMFDMFSQISEVLKNRKDRFVLITMAAGMTIETVKQAAGGDYPVIRIMPNLPALVGEGMILYTSDKSVTADDINAFTSDMKAAGRFDSIGEHLIDAASAVSGCGPAFVYMFADALADGAVSCGLPRDKALLYAYQTIKGAAEMLLETGKHPDELKDAVCSPGGSTIQGVLALEKNGFRAATSQAVEASYIRTKELGKK